MSKTVDEGTLQTDIFEELRSVQRVHTFMKLPEFINFIRRVPLMHIYDHPVLRSRGLSYEEITARIGLHTEVFTNIVNVGQIFPIVIACPDPPNCLGGGTIIDGFSRAKDFEMYYTFLMGVNSQYVDKVTVSAEFFKLNCNESERSAVMCITYALSTLVGKGMTDKVLSIYNDISDLLEKYGVTIGKLIGIDLQAENTKEYKQAMRSLATITNTLEAMRGALPDDLITTAKSLIFNAVQRYGNKRDVARFVTTLPSAMVMAALSIAASMKCYG